MSNWIKRKVLIYETDPSAEGGANLYGFVDNAVLNGIDPDGRLTISRRKAKLDIKCGETASVEWDLLLDKKAPCDGYIVQQIDFHCKVEDCPCKERSTPAKPNFTFWEAWFVRKGDRTEKEGSAFWDSSSTLAIDNTCGSKAKLGTVKFFCKDASDPASGGVGTGDLGSFNRKGSVL